MRGSLDVYKRQGLEKHLPGQVKAFIANHNIKFYVIDGIKIGKEIGLGGLSLIHISPVAELEPYVELVDMVLIMSVHPGFGGQSFIPSSLEKIRETRALLDRVNSTADIEVDGGIYTTNVREVLEAGANVIVAGSAIFRGDAAENTKNMMEILRAYE